MGKIGTFIGTGSNDNPPDITWRNQTVDEALGACYQRLADEIHDMYRERNKLLADYDLRIEQYHQERNEILKRYEYEQR